jgi:hypothetical protein
MREDEKWRPRKRLLQVQAERGWDDSALYSRERFKIEDSPSNAEKVDLPSGGILL